MNKISKNEYYNIHYFLRSKYGKPDHCDSRDCSKKSKVFDYALKKGEEYRYDRNCFLMLCRGCHIKYDRKERTLEKRKVEMLGNKRGFKKGMIPWNKGKTHLQGINHPMYGKTHSPETRIKLSESHRGQIPWNKGIPMSLESKLKLSNSQKLRMSKIKK